MIDPFIRRICYRVKDSEYRRQIRNPNENAYGTVVSYDPVQEKFLPVICMHGGSMWLCLDCAVAILLELPTPKKPCPVHKGPGPFTHGCDWPECPLSLFNSPADAFAS
jgi:hypothetical protein